MSELIHKIKSFSTLSPGWNSYEAKPIPQPAVDRALTLLECLRSFDFSWEAFPTARESIQIEHEADDMYFELEVYSDRVALLIEDEGKAVDEREDVSVDDITLALQNRM